MSIMKPKKSPQMSDESIMKEGKPSLSIALSTQRHGKKKMMAEGGEVHAADLMDDDERAGSIAEAIMRKRKMMAEGGMVDLEANSEEHPNLYDDLNEDAANAPQGDVSQISPQPEDSNEHGDPREDEAENKHDMISAIRAKLKAKRGV